MPKNAKIEAEIHQISKAPSTTPAQSEYERRERDDVLRDLREVERAPLADRQEARDNFMRAMRDEPTLVAERVDWILDGNYGYGAMQMAKRVLPNKRMNRTAALTHLVGALEWRCPQAMAIAAWKKLTKAQQAAVDHAVQHVIDHALENEEAA